MASSDWPIAWWNLKGSNPLRPWRPLREAHFGFQAIARLNLIPELTFYNPLRPSRPLREVTSYGKRVCKNPRG
jgi:hypothetical protein